MMSVLLEGHYREDAAYETVVVNVTERCNLRYAHRFVYRDALRGCGTYRRVVRNLTRLRGDLESPVQERLEA